jgi:hypothetical protein
MKVNVGGKWDAGWGHCGTYKAGKSNAKWCKWDKKNGVLAQDVCEECGKCQDKIEEDAVCNAESYSSAWGKCPSYTSGYYTTNGINNYHFCKSDYSKHMKRGACTAQMACSECTKEHMGVCTGTETFNAGWGKCGSYTVGKEGDKKVLKKNNNGELVWSYGNHYWCDKDKKNGQFANQACPQCGQCSDKVTPTECKDWNCAQWCEHYDAKYDSVYAASGCNEDGDDCNCE